MCFLDLSGYTRLTEERGDEAAAAIAATLGQLVQLTAQGGGAAEKPVMEPVRVEKTPGRNEPCWCGSGKKFKLCHGR